MALKTDPVQIFRDRPGIALQEWCDATGLGRRMYYEYRRRALETNATHTAPHNAPTARLDGESATDGDGNATHIAQDAARPENVAQRTERTAPRTDRAPYRTAPHSAEGADALGTALVQDVRKRNAILICIFALATVASVENMYKVVSTFTGDIVSNVALTGVFAVSGICFMLAGVRNRATIAIVASLVVFEAICNASSIFGGLYKWDNPGIQTNVFLHQVHTLVHFFPIKNVAQCISLFAASAIASVQFFAIREVRPPHRPHRK